jgi:hypothetical protein
LVKLGHGETATKDGRRRVVALERKSAPFAESVKSAVRLRFRINGSWTGIF